MRTNPLIAAALILLPANVSAQIRGDPAAVAAAEKLLDHAGGRQAWGHARTFYVEQRAFPRSGEIIQQKVWRDLDTGRRRIERIAPSERYTEWLSPGGGYEVRNGVKTAYSAEDLAIEIQGLKQEPYAVYRRLARRDPALRVQLRNENALYVYDRGEHLLCWFLLDAKGAAISWGNFWNGSVNQHYYGPTADKGDVNLPAWGVSATGTYRFEYLAARMDSQDIDEASRKAEGQEAPASR